MSQPHDPQPRPVYGQEGAYTAHPAADGAPVPPPADVPVPPAGAAVPPPADVSAQAGAPGASPGPGYPGAPHTPGGYAPGGSRPAGYPPAGYPPAGYAAAPPLPRNDLAVWSLVLGLLGVLGCLFFTGIPAVIVGGNARKAVAAGQADNEGMATAGIVLGWVANALGVLVVILVLLVTVLPLLFLGLTIPFLDTASR